MTSSPRLPGLVVSVLLLSGCGDAPAGAKYHFTAQGEGPEGKDLHQHRVGIAAPGLVTDGTTPLKAGRAIRTHLFGNETSESAIVTKAGLFITSQTVKGELPNPQLIVPSTVRLGMAWEVLGPDDKPDFVFEVLAREENATTPHGVGTVWTIGQTSSTGVRERRYLEGVGRIDLEPEILPLDDQELEAPAHRPVAMEELALPASLAFTQNAGWVEGLALVRPDPGGAAVLTVFGEGPTDSYAVRVAPSACAKLEAGQLSELAATPGRAFRRTTGLTCPSSPYCVPPPGLGTSGAVCPELVLHGNGARVAADGTVTWIARTWTGGLASAGLGAFGPEDTVVKSGGGVTAVIPMVGVDGGGDALALERLDTGRVGVPNQFGDPFSFDPASYLALEHSFPIDERARKPSYVQMIDLGVDAQGRQQLMMLDDQHVLSWSRLEGARFTHPRTVGRLSGRLSVQARRGGPDVLRVTSDGSVDRFVVRDDEVKLEHLADLTVPPTHTAIGAFVDGDRLLIGTLANGTPDGRGQTASLHLFLTAPLSGSEVVRIPRVLTLTARPLAGAMGQVAAICWRAAGERVDRSGWTVDGVVPDLLVEVTPGDQCVLVGFDTRQGQAHTLTRIAGLVPGVGRVLFHAAAQSAAPGLSVSEPVAVLADGSLVTARRRFTRGGLDMGLPDRLNSPSSAFTRARIADLGGAGLWLVDTSADGGAVLELKGQTTVRFPGAEREVPWFALLPTGLATESGWFLYPDGGIEKPPPLQGTRCQRGPDGRWCGAIDNPRALFCEDGDGGVRTVANPVVPQSCGGWLPRGDGTWLLSGELRASTFDPRAMTLTDEGTLDVRGQTVDRHGRGLLAVHTWGGPLHTLRLAEAGFPQAFAVPDGWWTLGGNTINGIRFVSTPDVTLMSMTWTGVFGTADPTTFRLAPLP